MEVPGLFSDKVVLKKRVNLLCEEFSELSFRRCRLAYFEIKDKVYTQQQLIDVATKHYISQVNKTLQ